MPTDDQVVSCPFDHSDALEFDPALVALAARGPVSRIRLSYGEAGAWLVTSHAGVRQVTCDLRLSRAAIVGRDYPRMTPEPIVSPESANVADTPVGAAAHLTICELLAVPEEDREDLRACTMRLLPPHPVPRPASGRLSGRGALGHRDHPPLPPPPSGDLVTPPVHTTRREGSRTVRRSRRPVGRPRDTWWHDAVAPVCSLLRRPSSVGSAVVLRRKRVLRPLDEFEVLEDEEDPEALGRRRVNPDGPARPTGSSAVRAPSRHGGFPRCFTR